MNTKTYKLTKDNPDMSKLQEKNREELIKQVKSINFNSLGRNTKYKKLRYEDKDTVIRSPIMSFNREHINRWLENPITYEKELRNLSNYLYSVNPTYKSVVRYMALMLLFNWTLNIDAFEENPKKVKKNFIEVSSYLDKIVDEFEYKKVLLSAYKKDIYYGYEIETDDSYFILELDSDYCKISSYEDGLYNFKFNFEFFNGREKTLETYPEEFKTKYNLYKNSNGKVNSWIEIDSEYSFCIKINPETKYSLPPFIGMINSLYDAEEYKQLKKERAENDNYLLLHQKIPMSNTEPDKFLLNLNIAEQFHESASNDLQDGVELVTSPMDLTAVKTEKSNKDSDLVKEAMREVYSDAGVSQDLFNSGNGTSVGLEKSTKTDEEVALFALTQIEKHVNRKLKYKFPKIKSTISFLKMTIFNEEKFKDNLLKQAQSGVPVKFDLASANGSNPNKVLHKLTLENEIFNLGDMFEPLKTSHTLTNDEGGRPSVGDDASDSTITNRDNDSDAKKKAKT